MTTPETKRGLLVDDDWGPDPLDGIPETVVERAGSADVDTAGGCG